MLGGGTESRAGGSLAEWVVSVQEEAPSLPAGPGGEGFELLTWGEEEDLGECSFSRCFFKSIRNCLLQKQRKQDQNAKSKGAWGRESTWSGSQNILPDFLGS